MAQAAPVVLIVEDDEGIRRFLRAVFATEGYRVIESITGRRGTLDAGIQKLDLAIVDLGLPDLDGFQVIAAIRAWSRIPIIVLSARQQETDKIAALDAGADDYVTKPFGIGELLARVRVALRHGARTGEGETQLQLGPVTIDFVTRKAIRQNADIHPTPIEFRLITVLAAHLGMVVTHRQLLTEVWGPAYVSNTHYLRIYLKQIRDKLEVDPMRPRHFMTEAGVGYRMVGDLSN
jgi:two-component system, OmpR family, KDP operon response regulator KdpE